MTPDDFLNSQHHISFAIGDYQLVLGQPSSTLIVGLLSAIYIYFAMLFFRSLREQQSRKYWSAGLFFSALASLVAGLYYQLLGFHIRCEGLNQCYATSAWEIFYYLLTCLASFCFFSAIVWAMVSQRSRRFFFLWGLACCGCYLIGLGVGVGFEISYLLSFQFSVMMTLILIFPIVILNLNRLLLRPRALDRVLLHSSLMLLLSSAVYFAYSNFGITEFLWRHSLWLSENDVLHLSLIFWVLYLNPRLLKVMRDG